MQQKFPRIIIPVLFLASLLPGCGLASPDPSPTNPPPPTFTVLPSKTPEVSATNTPSPTRTPTPEPTATASETPTQTPDLAVTASFESTQALENVMKRVEEVLDEYGYSIYEGKLGWAGSEPVRLDVQDFGSLAYEPVAETQEFGDFILHVDIAWDSTSGLAGCGVIFRSEPNLLDGEQYMLRTMRLSGAPVWTVEYWDFGRIRNTLRSEPSSDILEGKDAINNFILITEGNTLRFYANGKRLSGLSIHQRERGRIAFLVWQESGITTCQFENAWIWELNK